MARTLSSLEGASVRLSAARRYIRPSDSPGAPPDIPPASRQYILSSDCGHSQMRVASHRWLKTFSLYHRWGTTLGLWAHGGNPLIRQT